MKFYNGFNVVEIIVDFYPNNMSLFVQVLRLCHVCFCKVENEIEKLEYVLR